MFCSKCGKQIEDNAKFCPYCGQITYLGVNADEAASPIARVSHRKRNWIIAAAATVAVALAAFGIWKIWFAYPTTPEGVLTAFLEAWQRGDDDAMCEYTRCDDDYYEAVIEHMAEHARLKSFKLGETSLNGSYCNIDVELEMTDGSSSSGTAGLYELDGKWYVDWDGMHEQER